MAGHQLIGKILVEADGSDKLRIPQEESTHLLKGESPGPRDGFADFGGKI